MIELIRSTPTKRGDGTIREEDGHEKNFFDNMLFGIVPEHHCRILDNAALEPKEFWEVNALGHVMAPAHEGT